MIGRMVLGTAVVAATLVAAGAAWGGGFSTVELRSLPEGVEPGEPWEARFTVLVHGRTPVEKLSPGVRIVRADGGREHTIPARETAKAGTYSADVTFPEAGRWRIEVSERPDIDGHPFAGHSFGTVQIGDPEEASAGAGGGGDWLLALAAALVLGLLAGGAAWRAQRPPRAPVPPPPAR